MEIKTEVIGQEWWGMVEGSREDQGAASTTNRGIVMQASTDMGLAIQAREDRLVGWGNTDRVGEVYHPVLLVQPSPIPMPGTIRVFRD